MVLDSLQYLSMLEYETQSLERASFLARTAICED